MFAVNSELRRWGFPIGGSRAEEMQVKVCNTIEHVVRLVECRAISKGSQWRRHNDA